MQQRAIVAAGLAAIILSGCTPEHSTSTGFLAYTPDAGYQWENPEAWFKKAVWTSGLTHPHVQHVVSDASEGMWVPAPGYKWTNPVVQPGFLFGSYEVLARDLKGDVLLQWSPGLVHSQFEHVVAYKDEGYWVPTPGYDFVTRGKLDVVWKAGLRDPEREHYLSGATEGTWELEPGYIEARGLFGSLYAAWSPGQIHPDQPCLMASTTRGQWTAISGYHLEDAGEGRFRIVGDRRETDWGGVVIGALVALIGYSSAQPQEGDDLAARALGRPVAKEVGNAGLEAAARAYGGSNSGACAGQVLPTTWGRR